MSIILATMAVGCATTQTAKTPAQPPGERYQDAPAAALVFTPAIADGMPAVFLARDQRQPSAFVGFEDLSTTFFYIRSDDRQMSDGWTFRRAVSEKFGTSYR